MSKWCRRIFRPIRRVALLIFNTCFIIFSQSWGDDEDEHFVDAPEEDEETPMKERNEDDTIATESPKSKAPSWLHRKNVYHKGKLRFSAGFVAGDLLFGCL